MTRLESVSCNAGLNAVNEVFEEVKKLSEEVKKREGQEDEFVKGELNAYKNVLDNLKRNVLIKYLVAIQEVAYEY